MKIEKAHEILKGLDAAQETRLKTFCKNVLTDRDKIVFDDKMLECLKRYAVEPEMVEEIRGYLNQIGFTRSKYRYEHIDTQLQRFAESNHKWYGYLESYKKAKEQMIDEVKNWKLESLRYLGNADIENALPRRDTHAGFDFILTGLRTKGEYLDDVYQHYQEREKQALLEGSFNTPILVGTRTQASGEFTEDGEFTYSFKDKTRAVAIVGIYLILAECKFAKPFQERLALTDWYAGGKSDEQISVWINKARESTYNYSTTVDYSHYDQSISSWLINDAFDIICAAFNQVCFDPELFNVIKRDFICKCFIDGHGNVVKSEKGVGSGSMFTQIIDSIVNRLMVMTYFNHLGVSEDSYKMMIMGDDNIIFTVDPLDSKDLATYLAHVFGVEVNHDKMSATTVKHAPEFLSRKWTLHGPWRHPFILIGKLLFPERFRRYESEADCLAILASYVRAFRKGMEELIDVEALFDDIANAGINVDRANRYMSGLEYYRLNYVA